MPDNLRVVPLYGSGIFHWRVERKSSPETLAWFIDEADARRFAVSWELLAVCKELLKAIEDHALYVHGSSELGEKARAVFSRIEWWDNEGK